MGRPCRAYHPFEGSEFSEGPELHNWPLPRWCILAPGEHPEPRLRSVAEIGAGTLSSYRYEFGSRVWWTNQGQTGHWEIVVSMAFLKLSRSIQKPASAAVGENL